MSLAGNRSNASLPPCGGGSGRGGDGTAGATPHRNPPPQGGRENSAPLLSIEDLRIQYRTDRGVLNAVDGASFAVPEGQMVGLVGESGCGKTTVARGITRVIPGNAR